MKLTKDAWIDIYKDKVSPRDLEILDKAYDVLESNTVCNAQYPWGERPVVLPWIKNNFSGIWNWDSAFHGLTVSRFDTDLAKNCIEIFLEYQEPDGFLPDVIFTNGNIENRCSKPPVMAYAAVEIYKRDDDINFLEKVYPKLCQNVNFWETQRQYNGLFFYSSQRDIEKDFYVLARYESGWDNSSRWDTPIIDLWPIDLNCYMVMTYRALEEMAKILGLDSKSWKEKSEVLSHLIEERLFDEARGSYVDVNRHTGAGITVLSPASFMPLFIGIASKEHAEKMARLATDESKFYPGMPTVSYDHPTYSTDYWRGPTWLNVAYFAAKGLKDYNYGTIADGIKEHILNMIYQNLENGIFENYDSLAQKGLCWHNFGWSAAFAIEFILNF